MELDKLKSELENNIAELLDTFANDLRYNVTTIKGISINNTLNDADSVYQTGLICFAVAVTLTI